MKTTVAGTVAANRTLLIDSAAGFDAKIYARSSSGGLGTDADANDDSGQGIRIGQGFGALVESRIVDGATIAAKLIYGSSGVGVAKGVDFANGNVTSSALSAKADSKSSARAAALGADSDAGAYVRYSDSAKVVLEGNSLTEGDAVVPARLARERRPERRRGCELLLRRRRHGRDGARDLPSRLTRPGRRQLGRPDCEPPRRGPGGSRVPLQGSPERRVA